MRTLVFLLAASLSGSICLAQSDSSKVVQQPQQAPVERQVAIPGIDTPISGGGMTAQTPMNPVPPAQNNKKRKKIHCNSTKRYSDASLAEYRFVSTQLVGLSGNGAEA